MIVKRNYVDPIGPGEAMVDFDPKTHRFGHVLASGDNVEVKYPYDFRVLSIEIYTPSFGNCSNGGYSSKNGFIYVPNAEGPNKASEVGIERVFFPEKRNSDIENPYWALIPAVLRTDKSGPMFGGCLAHSSDSRENRIFRIHDRWE